MKKIIIYILVITGLFSCNEKTSELKISKELIDLISNGTLKEKEFFDSKKDIYVSDYNDVKIFVKLNDFKFVKARPYDLLELYEKKHKAEFDGFNNFMNEVINKDFVLNENGFYEKSFYLDKDLKKEFESLSFEKFLKKYSFKKKDDGELYLNVKSLSGNRYLTISYLLYTKGLYLGGGCLGNGTKIYKFETLLNK